MQGFGMNLQVELQNALVMIQGLEDLQQYETRDRALYSAISLANAAGYQAGVRPADDTTGMPDWAQPTCAYIQLPTGQVAYWLAAPKLEYDGHTRAQKLDRIASLLKGAGNPDLQ